MRPKARRLRENSHAGMLRKRRGAPSWGQLPRHSFGTGCSPWCSDIPRCRQTCRAGYRPMDGGYGAAARNPRFCRLSSADAPHRLFHLGRVKSHAQHVQGERQVFSSFRQQNVKSMGQMASQGVRSPSGGCPVDFQAVNFLRLRSSRVDFRPGICRFRASLNR